MGLLDQFFDGENKSNAIHLGMLQGLLGTVGYQPKTVGAGQSMAAGIAGGMRGYDWHQDALKAIADRALKDMQTKQSQHQMDMAEKNFGLEQQKFESDKEFKNRQLAAQESQNAASNALERERLSSQNANASRGMDIQERGQGLNEQKFEQAKLEDALTRNREANQDALAAQKEQQRQEDIGRLFGGQGAGGMPSTTDGTGGGDEKSGSRYDPMASQKFDAKYGTDLSGKINRGAPEGATIDPATGAIVPRQGYGEYLNDKGSIEAVNKAKQEKLTRDIQDQSELVSVYDNKGQETKIPKSEYLSRINQQNPTPNLTDSGKQTITPTDPSGGLLAGEEMPNKQDTNTLRSLLSMGPDSKYMNFDNNGNLYDTRSTLTKPSAQSEAFRGDQGKAFSEQYTSMNKIGAQSSEVMNQIGRMRQLSDSISSGGKGANIMKDIASFGSQMGVNIDPKLGEKEAMTALANQMALNMRPEGSGAMSDKDLDTFKESVPRLSSSKQGREQMMRTMQEFAQRRISEQELANNYVQRHGQLDNGFNQVITDYRKNNPIKW